MPTPDPVHVLFDVDGVLNAIRYGTPPVDGWERHEKYKHRFGRYEGAALDNYTGAGFPIRYSPDLVDAVNALAARPLVQMYWLTTWRDEAAYGLSPRIGLTDGASWPVLGKREYAEVRDYWWKLVAAQRHHDLRPHARIVWVDDDLIDTSAREWAASLGDDRILLIQPDSEVGLTPDHMAQIGEWVG